MSRAALGCLRQLETQPLEPAVQVLVVQDRSQSRSQTEEVLRLARTYGGEAPLCRGAPDANAIGGTDEACTSGQQKKH